MSGNTTAIERLLEVSNNLWDAMYESGEVPTYAERSYYYLSLKDAMVENAKLRGQYEAVIDDYRSEVAKLRELCRYLLPFAESCGAEHPLMLELGVEVGE